MSDDVVMRGYTAAGAIFSADERYRYLLWRRWSRRPAAAFVMLNPSTADERTLDPTVRRCMGYAHKWGHGGIIVANLFAYRATDPRELAQAEDPVGPSNDATISGLLNGGPAIVVCAWGVHGRRLERERAVIRLLEAHPLYVLGLTNGGAPRHPLYMRGDLVAKLWRRPVGTP